MRKIDLTPYPIAEEKMFDIRSSLVAVLFNDTENIGPRELLVRDSLAKKIESWPDDTLLLEQDDYCKVVSGLNGTSHEQLTRDSVEFVHRVLEAPEVEVQERPTLHEVGK